jgi:hypothetical protein
MAVEHSTELNSLAVWKKRSKLLRPSDHDVALIHKE